MTTTATSTHTMRIPSSKMWHHLPTHPTDRTPTFLAQNKSYARDSHSPAPSSPKPHLCTTPTSKPREEASPPNLPAQKISMLLFYFKCAARFFTLYLLLKTRPHHIFPKTVPGFFLKSCFFFCVRGKIALRGSGPHGGMEGFPPGSFSDPPPSSIWGELPSGEAVVKFPLVRKLPGRAHIALQQEMDFRQQPEQRCGMHCACVLLHDCHSISTSCASYEVTLASVHMCTYALLTCFGQF